MNCSLVGLDLSRNRIGDEGAAAIGDALKVVSWRCNALVAMQINCGITSLDLGFNQDLGAEGAAAICNALTVWRRVCLCACMLASVTECR